MTIKTTILKMLGIRPTLLSADECGVAPSSKTIGREWLRLSDVERTTRINYFLRKMMFFNDLPHSKAPLVKIKAVVCPVPFGGWGYVEGRTEGIKINQRVLVVEADNDMSFSDVCVLIDHVPTMIIRASDGRLEVMVIAGQDYISELTKDNSDRLFMHTLEELNKLPAPLQSVLQDVLIGVYCESQDTNFGIAIEKILEYGEDRQWG